MIYSSIREIVDGSKPNWGEIVIVKKSVVIKYNVTSKFNVEERVQLPVNIIFPKEEHSGLIVILCLYGSVFYENKDTDIGIYMFPIKDLFKIKSDPEYNYCKILPGGDCKERTINHKNFLMCDNINFFASNRKLLWRLICM